ncbi:hypothetical protein [Planococcus halotolerans]|uniref:Uncharacterized protein n=1 Tax=Planococcus halotolerans TaxID=2233542 RepID=A0A365KUN9_9BACL|nr:hypothetical protein [Planococcus halotolerans]QHJ71348.1 hypothetical protein DNR44_012245 [Planococcus halotolerans]RAZ76797.1 hypothetical protein DP120_12270 [Planococcus halotolerans]
MTYLEKLNHEKNDYQKLINNLVKKYKIQFVGIGYSELIIPIDIVDEFVSELTKNKIIVNLVTWWCHCTEKNEKLYNCPHGLGGPDSEYTNGWFSEMGIQAFEVDVNILERANKLPEDSKIRDINNSVLHNILKINEDESFSPCLVPAIGLYVPKEWKNNS